MNVSYLEGPWFPWPDNQIQTMVQGIWGYDLVEKSWCNNDIIILIIWQNLVVNGKKISVKWIQFLKWYQKFETYNFP